VGSTQKYEDLQKENEELCDRIFAVQEEKEQLECEWQERHKSSAAEVSRLREHVTNIMETLNSERGNSGSLQEKIEFLTTELERRTAERDEIVGKLEEIETLNAHLIGHQNPKQKVGALAVLESPSRNFDQPLLNRGSTLYRSKKRTMSSSKKTESWPKK